ncbi:FtsX Cell division protein [Rhabdaerophilaceae bacterium]
MSMIERIRPHLAANAKDLRQFAAQLRSRATPFGTTLLAGLSKPFLVKRDHVLAPVLPTRSKAGMALMLVIAIMTFLAALTAGAVYLVGDASRDWSRAIAREMTIQIRPQAGRTIESDVSQAADIARRQRYVESVQVIDRREGEKLLEPWLGTGLDLSDLPVPRLVVLRLAGGVAPDLAGLKAALAERVPNAVLDDHKLWLGRLKLMADTLIVLGLLILTLVLMATALAVAFATRGAMAGTAQIIDVLHLVGAEDAYIARQFQAHFLRLGLKGGGAGCLAAAAFFVLVGLVFGRFSNLSGMEQVEALFGRFSLPLAGYLSVVVIGCLVAAVTAIVSRVTVYRTLRGMEDGQ